MFVSYLLVNYCKYKLHLYLFNTSNVKNSIKYRY